MLWPPKVERHRERVQWEARGFDPDLLLAFIKQESGGVIGKKARATCRKGPIPLLNGGDIIYDRALGLMQIVPRTIASYNEHNPTVYFEQMSGKTLNDARIQIRVGTGVLASEIKTLNNFFPDEFPGRTPATIDTNQLLMTILAYRMGGPGLRKKLNKLKERGLALTYENIVQEFPLWGYRPPNEETGEPGKWINRPIHYTDTIWEAALNHGFEPGSSPTFPPGPGPDTEIAGTGGGLGVLLAVGLALYFLGSKR